MTTAPRVRSAAEANDGVICTARPRWRALQGISPMTAASRDVLVSSGAVKSDAAAAVSPGDPKFTRFSPNPDELPEAP